MYFTKERKMEKQIVGVEYVTLWDDGVEVVTSAMYNIEQDSLRNPLPICRR